LNIKYLGNNTI